MKDFPIFTTDFGVASLVLREIPYRKEAYITVLDVQEGQLDQLIEECASFCRMAGAERIYAKGHEALMGYPVHALVIQMQGCIEVDPNMVSHLFPVTETTVGKWREICNKRMHDVDCAATQTQKEEKDILSEPGAYFVHQDEELLGIGWIVDREVRLICSVKSGAGERVMHTLLSAVDEGDVHLEVASTNGRAIRLYEKMGFIKTGIKSCWYRIR